MTVIALVRSELARLVATPLSRLAFVALMLVPVLYGGLYLWANQDPYAGIDRVPAALVVLDEGTTVDGEQVNYGDDVANDVLEDASFAWHEVSASEARDGVAAGTYDFSVTLPADFSTALASVSSDAPQRAQLELATDDANGYLSTTIATQATTSIRAAVVAQVGERATTQLLVGIADIRDSLQTAADGASKLADGVAAADAGAARLADGTSQLAAGAQQVAAGTAQLSATGDKIASAADDLAGDLPAVRAELVTRLTAAGLTTAQIGEALATLDPLAGDAAAANAKVQAVGAQLDALSAGAGQVAAGAASAHDGAVKLTAGLDALASGSVELSDRLADGVASIPATDAASRATTAAAVADPVEVDHRAVTAAGSYGAGLAPFFLSLAAWIGIYALFLIVKPVSRRAISAVRRPVRVALAGWATPALLGVVQAVAMFLVVKFALGFEVANPLGTLGLLALISTTFAAILLALNALLGSVGQFIGLVLMVVQLVTAGGTFPWQTLPAPLAALHHVLPMSYAVDGLRQVMYGGSATIALGDALVLGAWLLLGIGATALTTARMTRRRTLRDLRPSLIG